MANWCYNHVEFSGSAEALQKVEDLIDLMRDRQKQSGEGQRPDGCDGYYMFDIDYESDFPQCVHFESKWSPPTETIKFICDELNVSAVMDYEEMGCSVFGRWVYEPGEGEIQYDLDDEEIDELLIDEDGERYLIVDGKTLGEYEALEYLLERKIKTS
jgi:hypothetical protein